MFVRAFPRLVCIVLSVGVLAGPRNAGAQTDTEELQAKPVRRVVTHVPRPVQPRDLTRYARVLRLSEPQTVFLEVCHNRYSASLSDYLQRRYKDLDACAVAAGEALTGSLEAMSATEALSAVQDDMRRTIEESDDRLLGELQSALADSQLELLQRVRLDRQRARCFPMYCLIHPATIDLSALADQLDVAQTGPPEIDAVQAEYEFRATPLFLDARRVMDEIAAEEAARLALALHDERGVKLETGTSEAARRAAAYFAWLDQTGSRKLRVQKQIMALNSEYLPRLLSVLPNQAGNDLNAEFKRRANPEVYPDPADPACIYEDILNKGGLADHAEQSMREMWRAFRDAYDIKCTLIADEALHAGELFERTRVQDPRYWASREKVAKLKQERFDLVAGLLKQVMEVFGGDLKPDAVQAIRKHQKYVETVRQFNR